MEGRFFIPTEEPISRDLIDRVRRAPDEYFDIPFDMEEADRYPEQQLSPILSQSLVETPLYLLLVRIASTGIGGTRIHGFEDENEKVLLHELYARTPTHVIIRLREVIAWTLDITIYDDAFWEVLITEVTDPDAYTAILGTAPDLDPMERRGQSLIHRMLFVYKAHPNTDLITLSDNILLVTTHLNRLFDKVPSILRGDPDTGETMLDHYIRNHPRGSRQQYYVPVIAKAMEQAGIPFIYWNEDPDHPQKSVFEKGGVFHALLRNFVDRNNVPQREQDVGTIPIHYENFEFVWKLASFEERQALDHRDRTANKVARIILRLSNDQHEDMLRVIALTSHRVKSAAGAKARRRKY